MAEENDPNRPQAGTGAPGDGETAAAAGDGPAGTPDAKPADPATPATTASAAGSEMSALSQIARAAEGESSGRSADAMAERLIDSLISDPELAAELKKSPELIRGFASVAKLTADAATLRQYDLEIIKSNGMLYLTVVGCVGATLLMVVGSIFVIAIMQLNMMGPWLKGTITIAVPDGLIALGSAAIGALAGLLTPLTGRR